MNRFTAYRTLIGSGTHNEKQRNDSHQPQYEGVISSKGKVFVQWLTAINSVSVFDSFDDMLEIHGHPEYGTKFVFHDKKVKMPEWWDIAYSKLKEKDFLEN